MRPLRLPTTPCLLVLLALLLALPARAATPAGIVMAGTPEILASTADAAAITSVHWQRQFTPVTAASRIDAGQPLWLRLRLHNPGPGTHGGWLDPWPLALTVLQAWQLQDGVLQPLADQPSARAIAVALPPGEHTLYLRMDTELGQPLLLRWLPGHEASNTLLLRRFAAGSALGALSLLVLVAGACLLLYRDRTYAPFAVQAAATACWLWLAWTASGPWQLPLAASGLLLAGLSLPWLAQALPGQAAWSPRRRQGLAVLGLLLLAAVWLLPASRAALLALASYLIANAAFVVQGVRLGMAGRQGQPGIAALQGLPLTVCVALLLSGDRSLATLLTPNPWILGSVLASEAAMLALLVRHTQHRWLDHEARQRLLASIEGETRSRGDILGRISHEIRTPMSGILGMAELLQDTPLTPQQQEYVETIQGSGHSLLNLIGEVLDDSALAAEGAVTHEAPFEPESLLLEVVNGFRSLAEQRHTELICDLPDRLPAVVVGDPVRLRQVLLHVIGHAVRASTANAVTITLSCTVNGTQAAFEFSVHHHGGLAPEAIARILGAEVQPPQELPLASTAGLSVARRLLGMMGGHISISSQPEQGTHVRFGLPLPVEMQELPRAVRDTRLLEHRRLLVVDDNEALRCTLCRQAERWGMLAEAARSGNEALGQVRNRVAMNQPYDAVLLDDRLPGMNGLELARRIRQIQEPPPAILMLTGLRHFPSAADMHGAGIHRLLTKPATGSSLKLALADALGTPAPAPTGHPALLHHPVSVLLAEDNPVTARVIEAMLKKLGAVCTRVENGQQAVEACQLNHFDLVLMDCDMPVMDGYAATRALREWERDTGRAPLRIHALTAHILDEYRERSRRAGMDGHLGKPVNLQQLAGVLEHCLQG